MKFPFSEEVLNIRISKYDILQKVILSTLDNSREFANHHHTILVITDNYSSTITYHSRI